MSDIAETETMDPDDLAIRVARQLAGEAIGFLIDVLKDQKASTSDRIQAARHVLEVAGCLSL